MQRKATLASRTQGREPQFNLFEMPRARAPHGPALYFKMKAMVQAHPDVLRAYKADFYVHDRRKIRTMQAGERWIWVLRRNGTILFPVGVGQAPTWVTHWLDEGQPTMTFLVTVTANHWDGTVQEVSVQQARELAHEPPPKGLVAWHLSMFGVTLVREGVEIAQASRISDRVVVTADNALVGSFPSWKEAAGELERRFGPMPPTVGA